MSNVSLRKPIIEESDEQLVKEENELPLLKNTAVRTRAKKNFKQRMSELDEKLNSEKVDNSKNIDKTKVITSPRSNSDLDDPQEDQTKTNLKPRKKRGGTLIKTQLAEEKTIETQEHVNHAYESDSNAKSEKNKIEETQEIEPKKRTRKTRKKAVESNLNDLKDDVEDKDPSILAIIVHQTDKLRTDINIYNPVVRIHLVDLELKGQYVKKTKKDRNVLYYYEKENKKSDHISPVMTTKYDFKMNNSIIPKWEELVVFNDEFRHFTKERPNVLILFEIIDTHKPLEGGEVRHNYTSEDTGKAWQRIAWAFLKIVGADKTLNLEKKIRLQLFYSQTQYRTNSYDSLVPEVYYLYEKGPRVKYPASLHVTVKSILAPKSFEPGVGSVHVFEQEQLLNNLEMENPHEVYSNGNKDIRNSDLNLADEKQHDANNDLLDPAKLKKNTVVWSRIAGLPCRIPNELDLTLFTPKKGCYSIKFSNSGSLLACACVEESNVTPIFIYEIPTGKPFMKFYGHFGLIYEMSWSKLDTFLVTASNDATARVIDIEKKNSKEAHKLLPHPTFIYTVKFHPESLDIVCTGGYDKVIRVWSVNNKRKKSSKYGELLQEIFGHNGYINSVCFSFDGSILYSADSAGCIKSWTCYKPEEHTANHKEWILKDDIIINELKNQCISFIKLHPNQFRMIVHLRNNQLKLIDLRLQNIVQRYKNSFNMNQNLNSTITPCGTFLFNSGADTKISCWNIDTGDQITAASITLNYLKPARDIDFHPYDNLIAFCSYDTNAPIYVFKYSSEKATKEINTHSDISNLIEPKKDEAILNSVKNENLAKENLLQKKLADDVAKFNAYQLNRWKDVQEKLDSVYPTQQDNVPNTARSLKDLANNWSKNNLAGSITLSMADNPAIKPEFKYRGPKEAQDMVVALYDYTAQRGDELDLKKGDQIKVLVKENESWWMGELVRNKQEGYFPANYVQEKTANENSARGPISPIKMPKFTVRDAMAEYSRTYETNALESISKGINLPESSKINHKLSQALNLNKKNDDPTLETTPNKSTIKKLSKAENISNSADGNQISNEVDLINEVPTRDQPNRRRDFSKRRPFAHIISGHQSSSEA